MNIESKNHIWFCISSVLKTVALQCASGPLIQTLLSVLGFSTRYIYIFSTVLQAANVLTIVLFSRFADKGNIFKRASAIICINGITFAFFIPLCLTRTASFIVFLLFIGIAIVQSISLGLQTVCDYKLPYFVMRPENHGRISSINGIASSVITLLMGAIISAASKVMAYEKIMLFAFAASTIMVVLGGIIVLKLKNISENPLEIENENKKSLFEIFKEPVFVKLAPANFLRGIGIGLTSVLPAVALDLGYDESVTAAMVSVQSAAILIGCGIFGWLSRRIFPGNFVLFGSILFVLLPVLNIKSSVLFLVVYTIVFFGRNLVDYGVPSMLIYAVPAEIAGPYNAWRMVITNTSTIIGTAIAAVLPIPFLLIFTTTAQLISGWMYFKAKKMCRI